MINFQAFFTMGSVQLGSLCVRIKSVGSDISSGDSVAVIFADPTTKELDYLFGNRNLTKYVLRLLSDPPASVGTGSSTPSNNCENGFLNSLDYIASHLRAELANRGGNLDIAPVKPEIKIEESLDSLLNGNAAADSADLFNGDNGRLADDVDPDAEDDYLLRDDEGLLDDEEEDEDEAAPKRTSRSRRTKRPRREARRTTRARLKECDPDSTEGEEAQSEKKHWPYVKVRRFRIQCCRTARDKRDIPDKAGHILQCG
jgi:hypothetical protein